MFGRDINPYIYVEIAVATAIFFLLAVIAVSIDTTGDSGDSILHFLYSKYAFLHPEHFINHWAKPFFVLISAPYAQFGFIGIVILNCLLASLTGLFTSLSLRKLGVNLPVVPQLLFLFAPLYFQLIFSGLTEYLFAFMMALSLYLALDQKLFWASILISFLPFVRSEGLIILGVWAVYLILNQRWKKLPLLTFGHVFYSLIGWPYYEDILWVFTKIPYANANSPYGSGQLFDFVHRLNYVIEKPLYLLLVLGCGFVCLKAVRTYRAYFKSEWFILVFGGFATLFVAHSVFWWLGIFNSMGLPRVLNAVMPLIVLLCSLGLNLTLNVIKADRIKRLVMMGYLLLIVIWPFTNRVEGVVYSSSMFVIPENLLFESEVAPFIRDKYPDYEGRIIYSSAVYPSLSLGIDHFDVNKHRSLRELNSQELNPGSLIIWDDWFSPVEDGFSEADVHSMQNIEILKRFVRNVNDRVVVFVIAEVKG